VEEKIFRLLSEEIKKLPLSSEEQLGEKKVRLLSRYVSLLNKWNQAYNLTAVRNPEEMVQKHIIDSLSILPYLTKTPEQHTKPTLVDIGSGAGLPGIPLAIAHPEWHITLIDSNGKKAGFLNNTKRELALDNLDILNTRVEKVEQQYDIITCRAFSTLAEIVELSKQLWRSNTCLWAMKGKLPEEELRRLPKSYRVSATYALDVPGVGGERHLLKIVRTS
jgi:16S rRNA (guanine527-N7)-methyltransferase